MNKWMRLLVVPLALAPHEADASMFGEENANLAAIATNTLMTTTNLTTVVENTRTIIQSTNEVMAAARKSVELVQVLRNYSLEDLRRDAWRGMKRALPEFARLESEIETFRGEIEAIEAGRFFTHWGPHDAKMDILLQRQFVHAYRATLWPLIVPGLKGGAEENMTEADRLVYKRFQQAGMAKQRAWEATATSVLAAQVTSLSEEADASESIESKQNDVAIKTGLQTMINTERMADHMDLTAAQLQQAKDRRDRFNRLMGDALRTSADDLFMPTAWHRRGESR